MDTTYDPTWTFGFLFRLAARAHRLSRADVVRRLLVGLANRYDAVICSYYALGGNAPSRSTEPVLDAVPVEGELRRIAAGVARRCREARTIVSALDLPERHAEDQARIEDVLGVCDTFGFPLMAEGDLHGCIVICLRGDEALTEADMQALLAVGECLHTALAHVRNVERHADAA